MKWNRFTVFAALFLTLPLFQGCSQAAKEVERPERIVSKRIVVYDKDTYTRLAGLWKTYCDAFPSEDAYANWMYAARYAGDPDYKNLLAKGYKKYPANPTILYLYSMQKFGCHDDLEGQQIMEKAASLDPDYVDPWFGLVGFYLDTDNEKLDVALRNILVKGGIPDDVLDYNYNILQLLDQNAILVTNGDMDTYPIWVLQRILGIRPDVIVANRSLLNTEWYPFMLMKQGAPRFVTHDELETMRQEVKKQAKGDYGALGDALVEKIIAAGQREGRPVYLAATLYLTGKIKDLWDNSRNLGLVHLATSSSASDRAQVQAFCSAWLEDFRTAGLDNWSLHHVERKMFGQRLAMNYAHSLYTLMDEIKQYAPGARLDLFNWYRSHLQELIPDKYGDEIGKMWCSSDDIEEIRSWCRKQGYLE